MRLAAVYSAAFAAAFFPAVVSARKVGNPAAQSIVLVNEPVALAQLSTFLELVEVPCNSVHVQGVMTPNQMVKVTGTGWDNGFLEFHVTKPTKTGGDKSRSQLASIVCYSKDIDGVPSDKAGKCSLKNFSGEDSSEIEEKEVSLPIKSHNDAFMFVCSSNDGSALQCDVFAFDNADASDGWRVNTVDLGVRVSPDLGFGLTADGVRVKKVYASTGLKAITDDPSLGCKVPPPSPPAGEEPILPSPKNSGSASPVEESPSEPKSVPSLPLSQTPSEVPLSQESPAPTQDGESPDSPQNEDNSMQEVENSASQSEVEAQRQADNGPLPSDDEA
ncbi:UNVERIFIED_CONTAM: MIC2-associated protein M2AP [Hammondia hammondi]|eukprot:XP_008886701.1 MIC2-associated protein M2AP [Hammondia hammondi]